MKDIFKKKYSLINAKYDVDMYRHSINEFYEKGYITWETRLIQLKPGDIVYIYYSGLPFESEGRILFRAEVLESNIKLKRNEIYGNKDESIVKAIKLTNVEAIAYADSDKYSKFNLQDKYGICFTRGGIYLQSENVQHKKLIVSIETDLHDRAELKDSLSCFNSKIKAYNDKTFCSCDKKHVTFIKQDGIKYFEGHHLVPSATLKKLGIEGYENNIFQLCSNCHNEIHYGHLDSKRALIYKLYSSKKSWMDDTFQKYAESMSVLDWLYKLYRVEKSK